MRFIRHITLNTGHSRDSYRNEISEEAMRVASSIIEAGRVERRVPIPAVQPYCMISLTTHGRCLVGTVFGPDYQDMRCPVVTIGVAGHSKCGAKLWDLLHIAWVPETDVQSGKCPAEPWCAARLDIGAAIYPEAMHWVGDFERCLAWAWIEKIGEKNER